MYSLAQLRNEIRGKGRTIGRQSLAGHRSRGHSAPASSRSSEAHSAIRACAIPIGNPSSRTAIHHAATRSRPSYSPSIKGSAVQSVPRLPQHRFPASAPGASAPVDKGCSEDLVVRLPQASPLSLPQILQSPVSSAVCMISPCEPAFTSAPLHSVARELSPPSPRSNQASLASPRFTSGRVATAGTFTSPRRGSTGPFVDAGVCRGRDDCRDDAKDSSKWRRHRGSLRQGAQSPSALPRRFRSEDFTCCGDRDDGQFIGAVGERLYAGRRKPGILKAADLDGNRGSAPAASVSLQGSSGSMACSPGRATRAQESTSELACGSTSELVAAKEQNNFKDNAATKGPLLPVATFRDSEDKILVHKPVALVETSTSNRRGSTGPLAGVGISGSSGVCRDDAKDNGKRRRSQGSLRQGGRSPSALPRRFRSEDFTCCGDRDDGQFIEGVGERLYAGRRKPGILKAADLDGNGR